jgi:maltooligosyltrehalose trehalohydrolase
VSEFKVWAPNAKRVQVRLDVGLLEMKPLPDGWWSACAPDAQNGTDYSFLVDGGDPLPDPRSPWQPYGVHGPSRLVDHSRFAWNDSGWQAPPLSSAIIYELHIGTFTPEGTFDSAIAQLGYLSSLGITHVELMPVHEFPGEWGWGYDGVDLFAPYHAYGGPDGLKRFVNACHREGLAVLLDVLYSHFGPDGNYLNRFGPYFTTRYSTPWGPAINLDGPGSTEVRRFLCDNALMWLRDYHFDGLRIDAVHAMFDSSAVHFLEQLATEIWALEAHIGRHLAVIAESDLNDPRVVTPLEAGGYGIDAQWSDDFHHALHAALTGERNGYYADFGALADVAKALTKGFVYDGRDSVFRKRQHGRRAQGLPGWRFLGYLQNHDQVGNRARGERSSHLMSPSRLKIGAALVLCGPFVPLLFQGEEFGASAPFRFFTNHIDPELAHSVSEGRRREFEAFGWPPEEVCDPQNPETFARSKLDWCEPARDAHSALLDWHKRLIALRRAVPELTDGRLDRTEVRYDEDGRWLILRRGPIAVVSNLADSRRVIPLPFPGVVLLSSNPGCLPAGGSLRHETSLELPPDSTAILGDIQSGVKAGLGAGVHS